VGTIFENSKVPLHYWLQCIYLMTSSKKGMSSHQLHRILGVTYKTAWFMSHRIREAMRIDNHDAPLGGEGKVVEADETYWGNWRKQPKGHRGWAHKEKIFSMVERKEKVRSFHVQATNAATLGPYLKKNVAPESRLFTDEASQYDSLGKGFSEHQTVAHSKREYGREEVHTNTIEGFFSILKRSFRGTYHMVSPKHMHRYLGEIDFRYNHRALNDLAQSHELVKGAKGKKLTYQALIKKNSS
jgi:transposase-like protein